MRVTISHLAERPGGGVLSQPAPVEFGAAVEHFLAARGGASDTAAGGRELTPNSRRVYRISLTAWAWSVLGTRPPTGRERRGAVPPLVPLAVLDDATAPDRIASAYRRRAEACGVRTANRELSVLRSACAFWIRRGWIRADPTSGLRARIPEPDSAPGPLTPGQLRQLFDEPSTAREQALWRLVYETGLSAEQVLALNVDDLHLSTGRIRLRGDDQEGREAPEGDRCLWWGPRCAEALPRLLAGRAAGPVFLTDRRAHPRVAERDRCRATGKGRLSVRRAADLLAAASRPLDPNGRAWTFMRIRQAGRQRAAEG